MPSLPYVTAPGNIEKALNAIKTAATPPNITQDFVKTILQIKGGSGNQITAFLRKVGFANSDGTPTDLYKSFRNPATSGQAALGALKIGYKPLYVRNEYMHRLPEKDLIGLVIEETGESKDSKVVYLVLSAIKAFKKFASESESTAADKGTSDATSPILPRDTDKEHSTALALKGSRRIGMNLGYTINLNLPATSDVAVFNAIFKSLKEHLLKDTDE